MKKIICLDTETTGLDRKNDEILQLSIIDGDGHVLFDNLIKPSHRRSWSKAQAVHGISPSDVSNCNTLFYYKSEIESILLSADIIVGYNIMNFDLPMLFNNGIKNEVKDGSVICDVMQEYAFVNGEWNDYTCDWRFKKLIDCAEHYKYPGKHWHNALDDAKATLFCFYAMCGNPPDLSRFVVGLHRNEADSPKPEVSKHTVPSDDISDSPESVSADTAPPKHKRGGTVRIIVGIVLILFSLTGFISGEPGAAAIVLAIGICLLAFGFKVRK